MYELSKDGWEVPDQTPVAVPAYIKKWDQRDSIREMIKLQLSQEAQDNGYETFEEADDFDVGDDFDPTSPYEECFDPETGLSQWDAPLSMEEPPSGGDPEPPAPTVEPVVIPPPVA